MIYKDEVAEFTSQKFTPVGGQIITCPKVTDDFNYQEAADTLDRDRVICKFADFQDGIRVLMLINRDNSNKNKGSKRWLRKIITKNRDEWISAFKLLYAIQKQTGGDIRIYSCVNDRKISKAISMFKHRQIDVMDGQEYTFYCDINGSFCSCLMKPENRLSRYFLLDVDTKDINEVEDFISDFVIEKIHVYETKKGFHYITAPFDTRLYVAGIHKTFEIKKDGLLLLSWNDEVMK